MEPKIYQILRKDGKYYNANDDFFTEQMCIGSYGMSRRASQDVINHFKLEDCEVIEHTELEFTQAMAGLTTRVIIQLESTRKLLEEIRYILPTISQLNKNTGKHMKNCAENLKLINPYFSSFLKSYEDQTDDVIADYNEFTLELSKVELYNCKALTHLVKATNADQKSMIGIANKVLKHKK